MTISSPASNPPHSRAILSAEERKMLAAMAKNNPQKPFTEVAQITGLAPELLRKLVRDGVLPGDAPYRVETVIGYCDVHVAMRIAEKLAEARQHVEGNGMLATEAAEKYSFDPQTIYNWHKNGWVRIVAAPGERNRRFNEGDIAVARAIVAITGKTRNIYPPKQRTTKRSKH